MIKKKNEGKAETLHIGQAGAKLNGSFCALFRKINEIFTIVAFLIDYY